MLSDADLAKIANLAKLNMGSGQSADLKDKLTQILDAMSALEAIDTSTVEPLFHLSDQMTMRDDQGQAGLDQNELLKNAPQHNHESFSLPRAFGAFEEL